MMTPLAENVWLIRYPLPKLGADLRRNVTLLRLHSGKLVIHSTGPFTAADVASISALGEPGWLVDSMLDHDTYANEGRTAFPLIPYLAPPEFSKDLDFPTANILPAPAEWGEELQVIELQGMPTTREHIFFHAPSRTLIVADLIFNFGDDEPLWTELLLRVAVGGEHGDLGPRLGQQRPGRRAHLIGLGPRVADDAVGLVLGLPAALTRLVLHPLQLVGGLFAHRPRPGLGLAPDWGQLMTLPRRVGRARGRRRPAPGTRR